MKKTQYIYGLMSGTSLDGLDVAVCSFDKVNDNWRYNIHYCITLPYNEDWLYKLSMAHLQNGAELIHLDRLYGYYLGETVNRIFSETGYKPSIIASHGHTIFHSPDQFYTLQLGSGAQLAARTGCTVICDFRSGDVALGGQGAPLVPIGDKLLFNEFESCLNLGGFANISFEHDGKRKAFDICPVNFVLNRLADKKGLKYDRDGNLGREGRIDPALLINLNEISFYQAPFPKSLGREWIEKEFNPVLEKSSCSLEDKFRTCYQHIATQISSVLNTNKLRNVLLTGGGTYNLFLCDLIKQSTTCELILPDPKIIDYKEALIFAFMGLLRNQGQITCLASVTGASRDSVGGAIYHD
jgi:anhydro-N-acetylmuramic acid kinase